MNHILLVAWKQQVYILPQDVGLGFRVQDYRVYIGYTETNQKGSGYWVWPQNVVRQGLDTKAPHTCELQQPRGQMLLTTTTRVHLRATKSLYTQSFNGHCRNRTTQDGHSSIPDSPNAATE